MMADSKFLASGWRDIDHGDCCDCVALARAFGAGPKAVDFNYCRYVLQKHWRLNCNHGSHVPGERATPPFLPRNAGDPVQAILVANTVDVPE